MVKYLGSKRTLLPAIMHTVEDLEIETALDVFSGTSRVGHAFKQHGWFVTANDMNVFAYTLAQCYIQANEELMGHDTRLLLRELQEVPVQGPGYFTQTFCQESRFFQPFNGEKIDSIRHHIDFLQLSPILKAIALTSLMEAADRVDSTCGVQMAYLKAWADRSYKPLELRIPHMLSGTGWAMNYPASEVVDQWEGDLAYVDPPYNQHSYRSNYHIWETLVLWDKPEHYGVACKRRDCQTTSSPFNYRSQFKSAFEQVIQGLKCRYILVSFSNEGFLLEDDLLDILEEKGEVCKEVYDYRRYIGHKIGIYNPGGYKVGREGRPDNKEFLFLVKCK